MFNGIVYKQGKIKKMKRNPKYVSGSLVMEISSNIKFKKKDVGESVCCDGVCLTLIGMRKKSFFFYLSKETLQKSNFKKAKIIRAKTIIETLEKLTYQKLGDTKELDVKAEAVESRFSSDDDIPKQ